MSCSCVKSRRVIGSKWPTLCKSATDNIIMYNARYQYRKSQIMISYLNTVNLERCWQSINYYCNYCCCYYLRFNWTIFLEILWVRPSPKGLPEKKLQGMLVQDSFTCRMTFLSPNQHCHSTEGIPNLTRQSSSRYSTG